MENRRDQAQEPADVAGGVDVGHHDEVRQVLEAKRPSELVPPGKVGMEGPPRAKHEADHKRGGGKRGDNQEAAERVPQRDAGREGGDRDPGQKPSRDQTDPPRGQEADLPGEDPPRQPEIGPAELVELQPSEVLLGNRIRDLVVDDPIAARQHGPRGRIAQYRREPGETEMGVEEVHAADRASYVKGRNGGSFLTGPCPHIGRRIFARDHPQTAPGSWAFRRRPLRPRRPWR